MGAKGYPRAPMEIGTQATGLPAVSLPNGARSLPPPLLKLLERFDKVCAALRGPSAP